MKKIAPWATNRLGLLLVFIVVSRLLFAWFVWKVNGPSGFLDPDSGTYIEAARSLLHGSFSQFGRPELFRTPGYPVLLMPAVALSHIAIVGLFENFILVAASAWLVWRISCTIFGNSTGSLAAAFLYGCDPVGFIYSGKLLSETLFTTQMLLFVLLLIQFLREHSYGRLLLAALALGGATYTRPIALYLGIWLVPLFVLFPRTLPWTQRLSRAVLFPVAFLLTLVPWIVRNHVVTNYDAFSSSPAWNLYFYSAAAVQAKLDHKDFYRVYEEWGALNEQNYFRMRPEQRTWSQAQLAQFWNAEGRRIVFQHSRLYFSIHLRGCAIVVFDTGVTDLLKVIRLYPQSGGLLSRVHDQGFVRATLWLIRGYPAAAILLPLLVAQLLLYYVLAIAGVRRLPGDMRLLFGLLVLYFILTSGIPSAVARYRVPIMPLICISAGAALGHWKWKRAAAESTIPPRQALAQPGL